MTKMQPTRGLFCQDAEAQQRRNSGGYREPGAGHAGGPLPQLKRRHLVPSVDDRRTQIIVLCDEFIDEQLEQVVYGSGGGMNAAAPCKLSVQLKMIGHSHQFASGSWHLCRIEAQLLKNRCNLGSKVQKTNFHRLIPFPSSQ